MFRFTKQVVCSLAVLAFAAPAVRAQPFVPIYPGGPTYGQYLSNLRAYGAAMRWVPPYALGYNPYPQVINYGPVYRGYYNPYLTGYGYNPLLNSYYNPYLGYYYP